MARTAADRGARRRGLQAAIRLAGTLGLVLTLGCAPRLGVGGEVSVEGRVTAIDATPMFVDGDGLLVVETHRHGALTIRVPARERSCLARGLATFHTLRLGDEIRAAGIVAEGGAVRICTDESHHLERVPPPENPLGPEAYRSRGPIPPAGDRST
jgi:hypothetical protein